jgi:hypothetical protein
VLPAAARGVVAVAGVTTEGNREVVAPDQARPEARPTDIERPSAAGSTILKPILDNAKAVAGLSGLFLYAVARIGIDGFYSRLHVTPEEIGLSQAVIVGRAALYLALFLAVFGAAGGVIVSVVAALIGMDRRKRSQGRNAYHGSHDAGSRVLWGVAAAILLFPLVLRLVMGRIFHPFFLGTSNTFLVALTVWLLLLTSVVVLAIRRRRYERTMWEAALPPPATGSWRASVPTESFRSPPLGTVSRVALGCVVALVAAGIMKLSYDRGVHQAAAVAQGKQVIPQGFGPLNIGAQPVCLQSLGSPQTPLPRGPYMYLGTAGGLSVLYDFQGLSNPKHQKRPIRVPSGGGGMVGASYDPGNKAFFC